MVGDQADMLQRIKATLPARWFGDDSPILDAVLSGLASAWSWIYGLLGAVSAQTRIGSAGGIWLDLIAQDFFGSRVARATGQPDDRFRSRILQEILRDRGTRAAVVSAVQDLTGRIPVIFEPAQPGDTGAWTAAGSYNAIGGWGSLDLPFQCFVTAFRPQDSGIAQVAGWGSCAGGYGEGAIEYASLALMAGQVTDADISTAVASVMPAAAVAWLRITN